MADNGVNKEFVERQKQRLLERKAELEVMVRHTEDVELERGEEEGDTQGDSGDQSQNLFEREVDATLEQQFGQEIEDVERALEKIEEGTYGVSDESGEQIPKGRLEAMPQAAYTIEEQQRREKVRRPPV